MLEIKETITFKSDELLNEGPGLRFDLPMLGEFVTGFVVRYRGKPYAYVNQCAHVPVELDWYQGGFFTTQKDYLICATHGAHYRPDNGFCVMGPCKGRSLKAIEVTEENEIITIHLASIK
ncbi:MAG TPA: Rieske 2Fe-2S domain-containing protein [Methylotenera sp.]|nr:Rieske 2Fe-2S domain-containing protein [Methylotenera sp.]HPH04500.1 Rieske 2Fe-2S domain-containing protein [Methylotenera sp.]HPN00905.1 Rieske 2Fe-2S domain-containing protein [Methylotenera sp.]